MDLMVSRNITMPWEGHYLQLRAEAFNVLNHVNPLNPKFQLFIKVWKMLPLPLANALGPHIVKHQG